MNKTLIIEIPYAGLGDHLFHSHLPRIAKETGKYEKVYISSHSPVRHSDYKHIVWDLNPFIDGFIEEKGITCNIAKVVAQAYSSLNNNLLDEIMLAYGLEDKLRMHEPEIYYQPIFVKAYNQSVYDPNFLSWVGTVDKKDVMSFLKKQNITFDAIMKIRTDKALYVPKKKDVFIETPSIEDFCNLIFSASQLYCLTSGTATLAAAIGKPATVF